MSEVACLLVGLLCQRLKPGGDLRSRHVAQQGGPASGFGYDLGRRQAMRCGSLSLLLQPSHHLRHQADIFQRQLTQPHSHAADDRLGRSSRLAETGGLVNRSDRFQFLGGVYELPDGRDDPCLPNSSITRNER